MSEQQQLQALIEVANNTLTLFSAGASDDVDKLSQVHTSLSGAASKRQKELDSQRDVLRALARQYELQKQASVRPASAPSEKDHRDKLASLDSAKYSLAKVIASLESELGSLEAQLARKREEVRSFDDASDASTLLDQQGQSGQRNVAEILRLKIYRDLGFIPVPAEGDSYDRMLVSSSTKPEVHTVSCQSQRQQGAYAMTNRLWDYSE